jgi:hypothetical protein
MFFSGKKYKNISDVQNNYEIIPHPKIFPLLLYFLPPCLIGPHMLLAKIASI